MKQDPEFIDHPEREEGFLRLGPARRSLVASAGAEEDTHTKSKFDFELHGPDNPCLITDY